MTLQNDPIWWLEGGVEIFYEHKKFLPETIDAVGLCMPYSYFVSISALEDYNN